MNFIPKIRLNFLYVFGKSEMNFAELLYVCQTTRNNLLDTRMVKLQTERYQEK